MTVPTNPSRAAGGNRFQELDVLRGLAALAVLLFHYLTQYGKLYLPRSAVPFGFPDGAYGVHLFFVISGFVIFMTLSRCRTATDFVVSRFSRLYPAFWAAALLTYTVGSLWPLPGQHYTVSALLMNLTMLPGFLFVFAPRLTAFPLIDGVYWSLFVELFFYAIMLALFVCGLLGNTIRLSVVWLAAAAAAHLLPNFGIPVPYRLQYLLVLGYAELFVAGIAFYEIYARGVNATRIALLAGCLAVHLIDHGVDSAERILAIFGVFGLAVSGRIRFVCVPPLLWLGTISYSLYLTHQMIGYAAIRALTGHGMPMAFAVPAAAALALTLASLLTYLIEHPARRAIRSGSVYLRQYLSGGLGVRGRPAGWIARDGAERPPVSERPLAPDGPLALDGPLASEGPLPSA